MLFLILIILSLTYEEGSGNNFTVCAGDDASLMCKTNNMSTVFAVVVLKGDDKIGSYNLRSGIYIDKKFENRYSLIKETTGIILKLKQTNKEDQGRFLCQIIYATEPDRTVEQHLIVKERWGSNEMSFVKITQDTCTILTCNTDAAGIVEIKTPENRTITGGKEHVLNSCIVPLTIGEYSCCLKDNCTQDACKSLILVKSLAESSRIDLQWIIYLFCGILIIYLILCIWYFKKRKVRDRKGSDKTITDKQSRCCSSVIYTKYVKYTQDTHIPLTTDENISDDEFIDTQDNKQNMMSYMHTEKTSKAGCLSTTSAVCIVSSLPCLSGTNTSKPCQATSAQCAVNTRCKTVASTLVSTSSVIGNDTSTSAVTNVSAIQCIVSSPNLNPGNTTPVPSIPSSLSSTKYTTSTNSNLVDAIIANTTSSSMTRTASYIPKTNPVTYVSASFSSATNSVYVAEQCFRGAVCANKVKSTPILATTSIPLTTTPSTAKTVSSTTRSGFVILSGHCDKGQDNTSENLIKDSESMTTSSLTGQSTFCSASATSIYSSDNQSTTTSKPSVTSGAAITTFSGSNTILLSSVQSQPISSASKHQTISTFDTNIKAAAQTTMTPQMNFTTEETNFLRFTSLVIKIGPCAVRRLFDMFNPPVELNKKIKDNKTKLKYLLIKGIITRGHWNVLFPANKHPSSKNFDVTLMMAFLRELCGMKAPKSGWNTLPATTDCSTEADLARIKYYRNKVLHTSSCSINSVEFESMWNDLSEAITRIGGECFISEARAILYSALDASYYNSYKELRAIYKNIIPQNIQVLMDIQIREMVEDDKTFFYTSASKSVKEAVNQSDIIIVTGPPGSGKTSTVNHVALQLQDDGYKICPVLSTKEIINYWMPDVPQLFILNDPFGIHDLNLCELRQWIIHQDILNTCIGYSSMKILVTVNSHIIKEKQVSENILSSFNVRIISLINADIALTKEERIGIFNAHAKYKERDDLKNMSVEIQNFTIYCFPLLCKLYTSDKASKLSDKDFFEITHSLIMRDIEEFKIHDRLRYFCLLYCMVNDNNLDEDLLSLNKETKSVKVSRKLLLKKCYLSTLIPREQIRSKMDTLLNTYLKKEDKRYQFIHDIIYDAFIRHVNSLPPDFKNIVLKTCASKFLNKRIRLSSIVYSETEEECITLNSDLESDWGARILQDINDGNWDGSVNNATLHYEKGDMLLAQSLKNLDETDFQNCCSLEIACSIIETVQKGGCLFIRRYLENVSILHFIVCLGLKHCIENLIKSRHVSTLRQSPLNLLLVACITGKTNIAKILLANQWSARYNITYIGDIKPLLKNYCSSSRGHLDVRNLSEINKAITEGKYIPCITLMYISSFYGHDSIVKLLLEHGADLNESTFFGRSSLYVSSEEGHDKVVELLLSHEADMNKCDEHGRSPLYASSALGHNKVVELLLSHEADINKCDKDGWSPLYASSAMGHDKVVELLLCHEPDINKCQQDGRSPLYVSSKEGHHKVVELLLSHEADINKCEKDGRSPLYVSSEEGHDKVVELLLRHQADINICYRYGRCPLYVSSERGHNKIVELLLCHEADINKCDKDGKSTLYVSSEKGYDKVVELLLCHEADINKCDKDGKSPLYVSSKEGNDKVVELLLCHEADINQCDKYNRSPLFVSSETGHDKVVELLLKHDANIHICGEYGKSPLYISSERGHEKVVELLLCHKANINKCQKDGKSPLYISSKKGHDKVVELLLCHEADINICGLYGRSPLYISSERGHDKVVELLLSHEVDMNKCDDRGRSPLYISSKKGHDTVVDLLLCHKADKNKCDKDGKSPLYVSSKEDHDKVVELLLSYDADINKCDKDGKSPLYVSSEKGHDKVVELLLSYDADINNCDKDGKSPLYVSSEKGHDKVVELLLSYDADINKCDKDGKSTLYVSSEKGYDKVVELLLSHEADINKCDKDGKSPLYVSSDEGHDKVVELLLSYDADINNCDKDGKSPLYVSSEKGHDKVVELLLSYDADINKCDKVVNHLYTYQLKNSMIKY